MTAWPDWAKWVGLGLLLSAVQAGGLRPVGHLFHTLQSSVKGAGCVTATVVLAEPHVFL